VKLKYSDILSNTEDGKLKGLKCLDCGKIIFPPKISCPECFSLNLQQTDLTREGVIKTFTVIRVAPEGYVAPYIVAMVELPEGVRVLGNVEYDPDGADESLIGKRVKIGWKKLDGDKFSGGAGMALVFSLLP